MAADESLPGISIPITSDWSDLDKSMDAAIADATSKSQAIASAINSGLSDIKPPDWSPILDSFSGMIASAMAKGQELGEAIQTALSAPDTGGFQESLNAIMGAMDKAGLSSEDLAEKLKDMFYGGESASMAQALATALGVVGDSATAAAGAESQLASSTADMGGAAATATDAATGLSTAEQSIADAAAAATTGLGGVGDAAKAAGDAETEAANGAQKFSEGAQALVDAQSKADAELSNAISVLAEVVNAYKDGSASADVLSRAEKDVEDATRSANPALKESGENAKDGAAGMEEMAKQLLALGQALAVTAGLVEFGKAALEAADHVDDATRAISALGKGSGEAEIAVDQLRAVAKDEALSLPQVLVAAQRMTAFLGSAQQVPAILSKLGDSAAAMGVSLSAASGAFETIIAKGEVSAKTLKALGLTMDDLGKAMGTTAEMAKAAFSALDQQGKIDALSTALGKFNGLAKEMNDDALGSMVRLGQAWDEVLEEIGKALDPVIKQLADFVSEDIIGNIKALAEAFNQLPGPVKEIAVAVGIAVAALAPLTAGAAALALSFSALQGILPAATGLLESFGLMASTVAVEEGAATVATEALSTAAETAGAGLTAVGGILALGVVVALTAAVAGFADLKAAMADTEEQAKKTDTTFQQWLGSLGKAAESLEDIRVAQDKVKQALDAGAISAENAKKLLDGLTDSMKALTAEQNKAIGLDMSSYLKGVGVSVQDLGAKLGYADAQAEANVITLQRLRDNLDQAKQKLVDTTDAWNKDLKSSADVATAYDAVNKAQQQLNSVLGSGSEKIKEASEKFNTYNSALKEFHDISASVTTDEQHQSDMMTALSARVTEAAASLDKAKQNLGVWVDELNQANPGTDRYNTALQQVSKWAAEVEKTQKAANAAIDDFNNKADVAGTKARAFADNIKAAADQAKVVEDNLRNLGVVVDQIPPKMSPLNQAMIDLGLNAGKVKTAVEDLKTPIEQLTTDLGNLIEKAQSSGDWSVVLGALDNFDKRIQNIAKTDLPEAVKELQAWVDEMQRHNAPAELMQGQLEKLDGLISKMAKEGYPGAKAALDQYIESLKKVPSAIQDIQAAQEQQLAKDQAILDLMKQRGDAYGYILDQQAKLLQEEIAYAEKTGQDASDIVLGLEKVRIKQEELKTSTHGLADEYVHMIDDVLKGFDQMGGVMADAIVNGKNLGDALIGQFKKIGQSILTDVLNAALLPLKQELLGLIDSLLPGLQGGLKATSGGISGLASASTAAAGAQTALTGATIPATAAVTSLAISAQLASISMFTMIGAIAGIVGAVAGIVGDVYLAAIDTKMFHVETSLLEIRNTLVNTEQDAWSQFGQMYLRLGECLNDLNSIRDTVKQLKLSGGQFPEQAITDLNDIAAAARQSFAILPTILGALSTIAQDIVTWDGYIMSDLDVMVQKLGYIVTNGLAANNAIEGLASAGDMQAAASSISDSIDAASSQASDEAASVVGSLADVSESVSGAVDDASSAISSQVGDSSDSVVSAVNDAGDSIDSLTTQVETYSSNVAGALAIADSAGKGIIAAVNTGRDATTAALEKQLAEAQKIAESGGSTVAHMVALQSEINAYQQLIAKAITDGDQRLADGYKQAMSAAQASLDQMVRGSALEQEHIDALKAEVKLDTELMNRAIADGDKTMAETYRQAAANANAELLPLLSDTAIYTRDAAAADGQLASTLPTAIQGVGYAATGAGALVAMHVDAAAVAIGAAVAAAKPASFTPTGGTTTNYGPGGSTQNAPTYTNPGIPVGTQPGFGPTGAPPNPYAGGAAPAAPAAPTGLPPGTFSKPIKTEGTITPDTTSQQGETIPGYQLPKFAKGGTVDVSGIGIVEKGEYVLDPQQWSTLFGAVEAANSGQTSTANAPTAPDYAALLKQAEQSDALLIKLEEGVRGVMAQIAIQHDQGAPPAMMELLRQQLLTAQAALNNYEVAMGYAKKTADAVTTGVPVVQNPNQGLPATVPAPIPPDLLNLKGGPTLPNAPAAAPPSAIPGPIQSAIDSLNTTLQAEKAKAVADAAHVIETQKLLADMLAPFAGKSIPGYLQSAVDTLQASVHQQEVQAKADLDSVVATQKLIAGMLAPYAPKPSGSTTDPTTTTAPTATTFAAFAPQALAYLLNIDQTLHGMSVAIPTFLAAAAPTTTPSIPPDLLGLKGGPATPNVPAPAQQAIPAVLQSAIDALEKSKDQEAMAKTADSLKLSETQALIADILAPYKGGEVPAFIRPTLDALKKTVEQQEAKIVADRDAVDATQAQIEKMLAPWQAAAPGTGTGVATPNNPNQGLPTSLPSGPDAATLQQQIIQMQGRIADAIESHSPQQVIDALKVMLASMQQQLADATRTASVAPAAPIVSNPLGNMDQRTIGFYAGALAELEDIRTTIHSERDVVTSMRDSFIVLGKNLGALLTPNAAALPSFDTGGPVPYDMTADLHAGEYVLPADITTMMRQMMRTPSYPTARQPNYDGASMPTQAVYITAPVTVITRGDPRQAAIEFTAHMKKMVPDGKAFSS